MSVDAMLNAVVSEVETIAKADNDLRFELANETKAAMRAAVNNCINTMIVQRNR
jgi:hypothetical protein